MNVPKLRFKDEDGQDFPEWEEKTLGDIFKFITTNSFSRELLSYDEGTVKNIHYGDIHKKFKSNFHIKNEQVPFISSHVDISRISEDCYCKEGDLIVADASEDYADIGKSIEIISLDNQKLLAGLHTYILRDVSKRIALGFSCYLMQTAHVRLQIKTLAAGISVLGISKGNLAKVCFWLPSLPEQTKIANFLTAVDDKIAELTKKVELLQRYKKGAMQQIFSQQLRFKDDNGQDFPEWEEKTLGEISNIYDGTHMTPDYQKSGIPFYSVEHLTSNNFANTKFIAQEVFERENKRVKLEKGDLLMTKIGDIGTVKYIDWDVEASFYVSLALIKQSEKANFLYVSHYIRTGAFQRELHNRTIHVAFPKKINLGEIGSCIVKLPCEKEQTKIANFLSALDEQINITQQQLTLSKQYKKSLLQQMFI
ncbi:MAG: restriction endonuclease subunit S [Thiotrichaceae bacterium]|nr:restriction endonuclease subunit S [Thiotrichaceae bacterium]